MTTGPEHFVSSAGADPRRELHADDVFSPTSKWGKAEGGLTARALLGLRVRPTMVGDLRSNKGRVDVHVGLKSNCVPTSSLFFKPIQNRPGHRRSLVVEGKKGGK